VIAAKWIAVWAVVALPLSAAVGFGLHLIGPTAEMFGSLIGMVIGIAVGAWCIGRYDSERRAW
jgi:hypothetical protein